MIPKDQRGHYLLVMLTEWLLFLSYRAVNIKQLTDCLLETFFIMLSEKVFSIQ